MSKKLQIIIKRQIDGPSTPELGTPTAPTFDSVNVPLVRPSTGPNPIASYSIERATSAAGPWTVAASGAGIFGNPPTAYTDGGRTAVTTYYYRARATDSAGRVSAYSATVSVTTPATVSPPVTTTFSPNYPRLAMVNVDPGIWGNAAYDARLGNYAICAHTRYNGSDGGVRPFGQSVPAIKAAAVASLGVVPIHTSYINNMETVNGDPAQQRVWDKCQAMNWWLRAPWPNGPISVSTYLSYDTINRTRAGQFPDSDGKTWIQWYADLMMRQNVTGEPGNAACPALDGFFTDNCFIAERSNGDYDRNGTTETAYANNAFALSVREGIKDHIDYIRSIWPTTTAQLGNAADWTGGVSAHFPDFPKANYTPRYDDIYPLAGVFDGALVEGYIVDSGESKEWLYRTNGIDGWYAIRNEARFFDGSVRNPAMNIYFCRDQSTNIAVAANYQKLRFSVAAVTVLSDGCVDDRLFVNWPTLPAIYTNGTGAGWLGQARETPRYDPYQSGVYVRHFVNGYVAVNPRNNGSQVFTLPVAVRNVQTGSTHNANTNIQIADRDGLFFVKV